MHAEAHHGDTVDLYRLEAACRADVRAPVSTFALMAAG